MEKHCFDDIVIEILTLLPVKCLMRFKCISKGWNTLIGYPSFVKLHNARSQPRLLFELQLSPGHTQPYLASKRRRLQGFILELAPRHYFNVREMSICSNHCNGLICLYSYKDTQTYLHNVTTGEIKALPFSVNHVQYPLRPRLFLGFDMVTGKYKLLQIYRAKTTILTLGTNTWRKIRVPPKCYFSSKRSIFLNGVLYSTASAYSISYFNFEEVKFGNLLPPKRRSFRDLNKMQTALRGKLVMNCCFDYPDMLRVEDGSLLYDGKDFIKLNINANSEKSASLEAARLDKTKLANVLATASIYNAPASLVFPDPFDLMEVSSFVENIIPLSSLI